MANSINVTDLTAVGSLSDTDTLLLIRGDGSSRKCYRIAGSDFKGKSAYDVAVEAGYEGTYDEWEEQVRTVAGFGVDFDPSTGTLTFGV